MIIHTVASTVPKEIAYIREDKVIKINIFYQMI